MGLAFRKDLPISNIFKLSAKGNLQKFKYPLRAYDKGKNV